MRSLGLSWTLSLSTVALSRFPRLHLRTRINANLRKKSLGLGGGCRDGGKLVCNARLPKLLLRADVVSYQCVP